MKARNIIFLVIAILFAACEPKRELKRYVYVNKDIEVCGVVNPMENIEWLKKEHNYYFDLVNSDKPLTTQIDEWGPHEYYTTLNGYYLFRNDSTMVDIIIFEDGEMTVMYDCNSEVIHEGRCIDIMHIFADKVRPVDNSLQSPIQKCPVWQPDPFDTTYLRNCSFIDTIAIYNRELIL